MAVSAKAMTMAKGFATSLPAPGVNLLLIVTLLVHVVDAYTQFRAGGVRFIFYIVVAFWGGWGVFRSSETFALQESLKDLKLPFILSGISFLLPYATNYFRTGSVYDAISIIVVLFPAWPIFILFLSGSRGRFISVLRAFMIAFWLFIFTAQSLEAAKTLIIDNYQPQIGVGQTLNNVKDLTVKSWERTREAFYNVQKLPDFFVKKAVGPLYPADVEEEKKGIEFANLREPGGKIYSDRSNVFLADLVAARVDKDVKVAIKCETPGVAAPQELTLRGDDIRTVRCTFTENTLEDDDIVEFTATYEFETIASLELSFVDEERRVAEKIKDFNTRAKNPDSPAVVGTNEIRQPISLFKEQPLSDVLGITISNNWPGELKRLKKLEVTVPAGYKLQNCFPKETAGTAENNKVAYSFNVEEFGTEEIEEYVTAICDVHIGTDAATRESLLQNKPGVVKHIISINASYDYEASIKRRIEVDESKPQATGEATP